jgi:hypothetical protein
VSNDIWIPRLWIIHIFQIRYFRSFIYQIWFQPTPYPPNALFKFSVSKSHTPLWETDYNLHKSNSTYFSDVDIARTHLISAIFRNGLQNLGKLPGEENTAWNLSTFTRRKTKKAEAASLAAGDFGNLIKTADSKTRVQRDITTKTLSEFAKQPGTILAALGSVACVFHREIVPYRQYEIWTRLLTWDQKWIYLVSYFVEAGAVQADEYVLQPWKNRKQDNIILEERETLENKQLRLRGKVLATSLAAFVVKKGRLTIPPEFVLQRCGILPERPTDAPGPEYCDTGLDQSETDRSPLTNAIHECNGTGGFSTELVTEASATAIFEESMFPELGPESTADEWTWERVENERLRGLKFAKAMNSLNTLRDEFDAGDGSVLGVFGDEYGIF